MTEKERQQKQSFREKQRELQFEFFKTLATMVTASFGLVAALAWNEAIKGLIDRYISADAGLRSKFYYAIIATTIAVGITFYLSKISEKLIEKQKPK